MASGFNSYIHFAGEIFLKLSMHLIWFIIRAKCIFEYLSGIGARYVSGFDTHMRQFCIK